MLALSHSAALPNLSKLCHAPPSCHHNLLKSLYVLPVDNDIHSQPYLLPPPPTSQNFGNHVVVLLEYKLGALVFVVILLGDLRVVLGNEDHVLRL